MSRIEHLKIVVYWWSVDRGWRFDVLELACDDWLWLSVALLLKAWFCKRLLFGLYFSSWWDYFSIFERASWCWRLWYVRSLFLGGSWPFLLVWWISSLLDCSRWRRLIWSYLQPLSSLTSLTWFPDLRRWPHAWRWKNFVTLVCFCCFLSSKHLVTLNEIHGWLCWSATWRHSALVRVKFYFCCIICDGLVSFRLIVKWILWQIRRRIDNGCLMIEWVIDRWACSKRHLIRL